MEVLARIRAGGREIERGLATTRQARAALRTQRFRVDQHRGYYRLELRADRDVHDRRATYFLAARYDGDLGRVLLGSARLIFVESRAGFRFPAEHAVEFALPAETRDIAASQPVEVSRGRSGHRHRRLQSPRSTGSPTRLPRRCCGPSQYERAAP
jgi:hypothetical protein